MTGRVFEIREFCLHDGPGIRTTVFFKGCPLRCWWCHNPEGQSFAVETLVHKDGTQRLCGTDWASADLAAELLRNADIFASSGGGVTFSGGEPLAQAAFLEEVLAHMKGKVACAIETSGFAPEDTYRRIISQMDFVYQDIKLPTPEGYAQECGCTAAAAEVVFRNAAWLKDSGVAYVFRVPLIPGVNDSAHTRAALRALLESAPVEYLPYNTAAAAKYPLLGRRFGRDSRASIPSHN